MPGAGVVTVADLLKRNAPVPVKVDDTDDVTRGISVGSLLRREGHAPHAVDRPLQPRAHQIADEPDEQAGKDRRALVRRGTIAAGTLLVAGSVLGAAILTEVGPTNNAGAQSPPTDTYPGQGLLDPGSPLAPPVGTVQLGQAASINTLDPGTAAPTSWAKIAFPGALAGVPTGTAAAAAADTAAKSAGGGNGSGSGANPGSTSGGTSGGGGSAPSHSGGGGGGSTPTQSKGAVGNLGDGLGNATKNVGGAVGGPVGDTVGGLGDTVNQTTDTVDGLLGTRSSNETKSARSSSTSSDSNDDSSSSSAPRDEESSDGGGSSGKKSSGGLLGTVGDLAGGLLG